MSFLRRLLSLDVIGRSIALNVEQDATIKRQREEIARLKLEHIRQTRDLVEQFWIVQEAGTDVREALFAGLSDLRDHVARLEEHSR